MTNTVRIRRTSASGVPRAGTVADVTARVEVETEQGSVAVYVLSFEPPIRYHGVRLYECQVRCEDCERVDRGGVI